MTYLLVLIHTRTHIRTYVYIEKICFKIRKESYSPKIVAFYESSCLNKEYIEAM